MARGLINQLISRTFSIARKWQQQQIRRLNIHEYQGAELVGKYGVNVSKGVAVSSIEEMKKAIQDVFPKEQELVVKSQILAGGRGLGTFQNGFKGGVHIVKLDEVEAISGTGLYLLGNYPNGGCGMCKINGLDHFVSWFCEKALSEKP
ncbi:succinate--CoA ligase [ADP-forming] subunit beta, mitochondrial-like [Tasmannia lanceolata]|uniref:succinate--CoA ligase [ADP-forming] subunit beta, mitochondrial-like n=1 Tax=Tasmannia lanceolata TaxID=3420 RepID=UPI004064C0F3